MFFHIQRNSRGQIEKSSTRKAWSLETTQLRISRKRDGSFPTPLACGVGLSEACHGPPQRARSAEHLHFPRGLRAPAAPRLAVVAWQRFQRDDLARPQGLLRPRTIPGLACRYRQEVS